jgi:hypothetical protein
MRTRTTSKSNPRRSDRRAGRQPARRAAATREQRVRDAGGPQDTAFYRCACGFGFEGDVSTHVACPHCGTDQEW